MIEEQIQQALVLANGRRKVRTLDLGDIKELVYEAKRNGRSRVGGGYVANSYGFASVQTVAEATTEIEVLMTGPGVNRNRHKMLVNIGLNSASKGAAQRPNPKYFSQQTTLILSDEDIRSLS